MVFMASAHTGTATLGTTRVLFSAACGGEGGGSIRSSELVCEGSFRLWWCWGKLMFTSSFASAFVLGVASDFSHARAGTAGHIGKRRPNIGVSLSKHCMIKDFFIPQNH